jgi:hypothetical protein
MEPPKKGFFDMCLAGEARAVLGVQMWVVVQC